MAKKQKDKLVKLLTKEKFSEIEGIFRKHFQFGLGMSNAKGQELPQMCGKDCFPAFCKMVRGSSMGLRRCNRQNRQSLAIAAETGQSYISLCHAGIVLVCVPVMDKDNILGGMFFGRCLWEPVSDTLVSDIKKKLKGVKVDDSQLLKTLKKLPIVQGLQHTEWV